MRTIHIGLAICLGVALIGCRKSKPTEESPPVADKGVNKEKNPVSDVGFKEKIVGTWVLVKDSLGQMTPGGTHEYTNDGKMAIVSILRSRGPDGRVIENRVPLEGTYVLEGDTIKSVVRSGGKEISGSSKIKALTDNQLIIEATEGPRTITVEYKKK